MEVKLIRFPNEQDWSWVKYCALNTIGKTPVSSVSSEWKKSILRANHSPIRELIFSFKMIIPYWVSVHFVRHHIGVNHYVQTQRNDRQEKKDYDRAVEPQGKLVSHIMSINAQELIYMSHKRLCNKASKETREVMKLICNEVIKVCPEMKEFLVPQCYYTNGRCDEFNSCGFNKTFCNNEKITEVVEPERNLFNYEELDKEYYNGKKGC